MGRFFRRNPEAEDPRDPVGQNPTGRPRKSSAGKRRQEKRKMDRTLKNTQWDKGV